jgi:hypothetical protein
MDPAQVFSLTGDIKVQEVIGRLKFLAKIRHGEKINVRELFVRDNDSVAQRFLRTLHNWTTYLSASQTVESKEATLAFINETVNNAITLIAVYRKDADEFKQNIADIIINNLESSKAGISNLISTYKGDRRFISEAEAGIQTLEARIKSMKMPGMTNRSFMPSSSLASISSSASATSTSTSLSTTESAESSS